MDSSVLLMHHDPNDLRSQIRLLILPKNVPLVPKGNCPMSMFCIYATAQLFIDNSPIPNKTIFVFRKRLKERENVINLKVYSSQTQTVWVYMVTEATFVEKIRDSL